MGATRRILLVKWEGKPITETVVFGISAQNVIAANGGSIMTTA
jgi:hypothetical protein